jgi:hypothetical protein
MKIEISTFSISDWSIGLFSAEGEDDSGSFYILTIGFLLINIDIFIYK